VLRGNPPEDDLDVGGAWRVDLFWLFARKLDRARRVVGDAVVVEHHRARIEGFANRLPRDSLRVQLRDDVDEVLRREAVEATATDQRQNFELDPVLVTGRLGNVDAGRLPLLRGLCERGRHRLVPAQIGNSLRGELAGEPALSLERLASHLKAARVSRRRLAAAEPVFDSEAALAGPRRAGDDPGRRHVRPPLSRAASEAGRRASAPRAPSGRRRRSRPRRHRRSPCAD
jgi:hypothetical protein